MLLAISRIRTSCFPTTFATHGANAGVAVPGAESQPRTVRAVVVGVAGFVAIGLLRWPLLPVMAVLVPVALVLEHRADKRRERA